MCCSVCDLIRCSCSRAVVYLLQIGMISLALVQILHPNNWTYSVLFKNSTFVTESIKQAAVKAVVAQIPLLADDTTTTTTTITTTTTTAPGGSLAPNSTLTPLLLHSEGRPGVIFWCLLLAAVNTVGLCALICECFLATLAYSLAAIGYLLVTVSLLGHSKWYFLDVTVWSLILLNTVLELFFQFCRGPVRQLLLQETQSDESASRSLRL